jgi:protein O-mannosyl-transferase
MKQKSEKTAKNLQTPKISKVVETSFKTMNRYVQYSFIVLFCFVLYGNTIQSDYALDDALVITQNNFTHKGFAGLKDIFSYDSFKGSGDTYINSVSGGRYRPLSIATFAIEHQFFGENPHISHFLNIVFYALTCLLLFILLSKILARYSNSHWYHSIPFVATLLFAAHPIHTEVVANIKSRDEILSLLFSLCNLWLVLKYLSTQKIVFLILSPFTFILALLSKEIAAIFVIIIPATIYFFSIISYKKIAIVMIPMLVFFIVFLFLRNSMIAKTTTDVKYVHDVMNYSFADMNFAQKWATIIFCLGVYLKLLFIPHPLTWDYYPYHIKIMEWSNFWVIASLILLILLAFLMIKGLKSKSIVSYSIILFMLPLGLTANILFPVGAFMCERFLYISSIGFVIVIAWLFAVHLYKIKLKPLALLLPILLLFSFKTMDRNKAWKDDDTLIATDCKTSVNSVRSNAEYGKKLYMKALKETNPEVQNNMYEEVMYYETKAFEICKNVETTNYILGTLYGKYKHDLNRAVFYLNNSIHLDPKHIEAYNNLGIAYGMLKQYDNAIETFQSALKASPNNIEVIRNLALTYQFMGQMDKAKLYDDKMKLLEANKVSKLK